MAEGRERSEWNRTSSILAMMVNSNPNRRRGKPAKPSDFHPMIAQAKKQTVSLRELKQVMVGR